MLENADHIDILRTSEVCRYEDGKIDQSESKKYQEGGALGAIHGDEEIIPSRPLAEEDNGAWNVGVKRSGEFLKAAEPEKREENYFITSLSLS